MDAVKFIEERDRMCKSFAACACEKCPAFIACTDESYGSCVVIMKSSMNAKDQVAIVEKWSTEHPRKTRQSKFLEQYPEATLNNLGVIPICPLKLIKTHENANRMCETRGKTCDDCMQEFWDEEVD